MNQNKMLAKAIAIASKAHENDLDKGGKAYILHCIRVMQRLRTDDPELMQIAILHDVVEDHGHEYGLDYLIEQGFSARVLNGVSRLTHNPVHSYGEYIEYIACSGDALRVKMEDLRDNSDITRLKGIRRKDVERMEKYHKAYLYLKSVEEPVNE